MKKQDMGKAVKSRGYIEINGINLKLRANNSGYTIKIRYQTCGIFGMRGI
jgi:hypothetical protein